MHAYHAWCWPSSSQSMCGAADFDDSSGMCVYMCAYMCAYMCTYIHTYTEHVALRTSMPQLSHADWVTLVAARYFSWRVAFNILA